jgi:hypothetical protein
VKNTRPALRARHHLSRGLRPRTLLYEQKLTTLVILPRAAEEAEQLEGERDFAVQVLVQAVVARPSRSAKAAASAWLCPRDLQWRQK